MNKLLPRRITATIYGVAAVFLVAVLGSAVVLTSATRDKAIADSQDQATRFVSGSEAALNRSLLGVDLLLADLSEGLQASSQATIVADATRNQLAQQMQGVVRQNLLVRYVAVLDARDEVVVSSDRQGAKAAIRLPAGFLRQVLEQPASTLAISAPFVSALTSQRVVYFARDLRLKDGSHIVAIAEVQLSLLTTILMQGADIEGLEVTLEHEAGPVLVSMPRRDDLSGQAITPALGEQVLDGSPRYLPARLSGAPAIVVARPTLHRNLLIVASIPLQSALRDWRTQQAFIWSAAGTFMLMILGVVYLTRMHLRRQWQSKATLNQALESMVDGFVLLDSKDRVLTWNRRFGEIFPWSRDMIRPLQPFQEIVERGEDHVVAAVVDGEQTASFDPHQKQQVQGERELTLAGGGVILAVTRRTPDGGSMCVYRDITEKRRHIADILEGKVQLQATLDALPDVLLELGLDGQCHRFHSPRTPGAAIDDVRNPVGRTIGDLLPPDAVAEVMAALQESYVSGFSAGRQFERRAAQGTTWFEISVSRMPVGEGVDARFIVILRNITDRKSAARQIEHLAFYDGLTGLPNRRMLLHRLTAAIVSNSRGSRHGGLLFLDLDKFKTLNDAHGHAMGDLLLKQVAARISRIMRDGDTVARLGGDEFVVLLENLSEDSAVATTQTRALGEAILAEMHQPFDIATHPYFSTCSIGATLFRDNQLSLDGLLKQADIAMYYAKIAGGRAMQFFEPAMQTVITARATLETELHTAMAANQFVLHYQPQVTDGGGLVGAEVLVRWQHPHRGMVPPAGFIEVAEETGLIVPIGLWVLEQACIQLERWSHHPRRSNLQIAVNVSARQFRSDDFADQVRDVLIRTGADPSKLKLELTESLLQDKVTETIRKMKSLAAIGIQFSMDDFGTGFSSLSYMTQLPLHQVKIDKSFVQGIGIDRKVELIIQTIIGMARSLDLAIVAEGVETEQQLAFLEKHGCTLYQGYLFGKPVALAEFDSELNAETTG
ncbi:bifunctional diguanylate cyclase/phosphodiesterase [Variovorax fucosicus]|uniref:bifunctional diguanylate cyclase/phosphodiesterase n=1 Tax=Variovorax fucosicus TaxID=3053517 RepID=UPI0025768832|nr:EAL domain-containing protein [Variovorax sp. J22G47]MDM0056298.1 EAL domain-containing protein [Variovorax sp. J22G47]